MSPIAKVGGLADVVGSLPQALMALGHDVRVFLPHYRMIDDLASEKPVPVGDTFTTEINPSWKKTTELWQTTVNGVPVILVGTDQWFDKSVSSETLYQPGGDHHLFFSSAVLQSFENLDWEPDVIHCHDWHTGFVPVLMREKWANRFSDVGCVFTIHNFAYQGNFGIEVLDQLGLSRSLFNPRQVEAFGRVNFIKAGCVFSDRVNTVSETYAREIQTAEYGHSLEGLMEHLAQEGRLSGIVNGIDRDFFNPETDPNIPAHFSAKDSSNKAICKSELLQELGFESSGDPLFGVVSRLSSQKGLDLLMEVTESLVDLPAQLVVQGLGDPAIAAGFRSLQARFPGRVRLVEEFNAGLAQRIYAGCDGFLMPSKFEPCGLGQMIAMRYGTIPIVRATGGLKDTVVESENGFVFMHASPFEFLAALQRATGTYREPMQWRKLVNRAMLENFNWTNSGKRYAALYEMALSDRMARTA